MKAVRLGSEVVRVVRVVRVLKAVNCEPVNFTASLFGHIVEDIFVAALTVYMILGFALALRLLWMKSIMGASVRRPLRAGTNLAVNALLVWPDAI